MDNSEFKKTGYYNPNRFAPKDSAFAFLLFVALFAAASYAVGAFISFLYREYQIKDIYLLMIISGIILQSLILLLAFAYSSFARVNLLSGGGLKARFQLYPLFFGVLMIAGMLWLFAPVTEVFVENIYSMGGKSLPVIDTDEANALAALFYVLFVSTVLPAVCEELLFRGIILNGFKPMGKVFAVVMSSLLFAIAHGSFSQMFYQFLVGLVIGGVYVLTENIINAMAMHFANNLLAFFFSLMQSSSELGTSLWVQNANNVFGIVLGAICFVSASVYFIGYALSRREKEFTGRQEDTHLKSCVSTNGSYENCQMLEYFWQAEFYTKESPVFFVYKDKGFKPMRKDSRRLFVPALTLGIIGAVFAVLNDFFVFF